MNELEIIDKIDLINDRVAFKLTNGCYAVFKKENNGLSYIRNFSKKEVEELRNDLIRNTPEFPNVSTTEEFQSNVKRIRQLEVDYKNLLEELKGSNKRHKLGIVEFATDSELIEDKRIKPSDNPTSNPFKQINERLDRLEDVSFDVIKNEAHSVRQPHIADGIITHSKLADDVVNYLDDINDRLTSLEALVNLMYDENKKNRG